MESEYYNGCVLKREKVEEIPIQQFTHFQRPFTREKKKPFSHFVIGFGNEYCMWIAPHCVVLCIDIRRINTMKFRFKYRYRWTLERTITATKKKRKLIKVSPKPWRKRLVWYKTTRENTWKGEWLRIEMRKFQYLFDNVKQKKRHK